MNDRLRKKAAIKRASQTARSRESVLNQEYLNKLEELYKNALDDINAKIRRYAGVDDTLSFRNLQQLKDEVGLSISELNTAQQRLLKAGMTGAAEVGAAVFVDGEKYKLLVNETVKKTINFMAEDGLQLSDRVWRVNQHTRAIIEQSIENAIIQGYSASKAAQDFLNNGQKVPSEILKKMQSAAPDNIKKILGRELLQNDASAYFNAKRMFQTEINRSYGLAYRDSCFEHDEVVGTRFCLSPNHKKRDICDLHANANVYGLGAGVYPKGKSPWPAHPMTRSYEEPVFSDEVSDADKEGKQTRTEWLQKQPSGLQANILGARIKQQAFAEGLLKENEFTTPYRSLKNRLAKRGL